MFVRSLHEPQGSFGVGELGGRAAAKAPSFSGLTARMRVTYVTLRARNKPLRKRFYVLTEPRQTKGKTMHFVRVLIISVATLAAGSAMAQQERVQGESACGRDTSRLCKKVINEGDFAVLGCLKENRTKLRPVCVKFLQDQGQL
jgi:hypothetical protein